MALRRDVFQAIADPTRRSILILLASQAMTPGAIADHFDSSRQTISRHIRVLSECDLLLKVPQGREIYYHFNAEEMKEVADFVAHFRKMWDDKFTRMERVLGRDNK